MQIPMRKIKERVYRGRLKKYLQAGQLYHSFLERRIEELEETMPLPGRAYFRSTMNRPDIRAYHEVQGQLSLIDADVFGLVGDYGERDLECAFDVGNFFYQIKLVDNMLDESEGSLEEKVELIERAKGALLRGEPSSDRDINYLAQISRSIPFPLNQEMLGIILRLRSGAVQSLSPLGGKERMEVSSTMGDLMGEAMYEIMGEHYEMPVWSREFLAQQGMTANLFDDVKDFRLDRRKKHGYSLSFYPELVGNFLHNFRKTHKTLPTFEEKKRFYTFMGLGIGFQLEELFGLKERS